MDKSNRTQKDILFLSISFFIVVVAWIGFNLYHNYVTSTINPDLQMQINPITPTFDRQTIEKLKTRALITPAYDFSGGAIVNEPSLTPSTSQIKTSSNSATPIASPSSTLTRTR